MQVQALLDLAALVKLVLNVLYNEIDGDDVRRSARNHHVGMFFGRPNVLVEGRFDEFLILRQDILESSPPLLHISENSPSQASVGIGVDEDFHIKEVADASRMEAQYSFKHNHVDHRPVNRCGLIFESRMGREVVDGNIH